MQAIKDYFKGVWHELQTVAWPSKGTVTGFTVGVIALSFFAGYFMGIFDVVFEKLLKIFIGAF